MVDRVDPVLACVRRSIDDGGLFSPGERVVVGVSGGPDSLCLLHVLRSLAPDYGLELHVAHLHHGLRGEEADVDAEFVRALAIDWGLPCIVGHADVPALAGEHRLAVEEAARRARYTFLAEVAAAAEAAAIAVGHHADDQVETVLMHYVRGSGLAGLRGMLPRTHLEEYRLLDGGQAAPERLWLIRPLLDVTRAEILAYCARHNLEPRFDRSNLDTTYFRNWLRHEVLPLLARHNPNVSEVLRRSARVIADDYALLRALLDEAWPRLVVEEAAESIVLDLAAWRSLPAGLQRSSLREAIHRLRRSLRNINFIHVENALLVARDGAAGDRSTLPGGLMLTLGYDRLTVSDAGRPERLPDWPLLPAGAEPLPVALPGQTRLPGTEWLLDARLVTPAGLPPGWQENDDLWQAFLDAQSAAPPLVLRARLPGDRFQPLGLGGRHARLADFLTNVKAPRAVRDRLPLLACRWGIAWVCGYRLDQRAALREDSAQALWLRFVSNEP